MRGEREGGGAEALRLLAQALNADNAILLLRDSETGDYVAVPESTPLPLALRDVVEPFRSGHASVVELASLLPAGAEPIRGSVVACDTESILVLVGDAPRLDAAREIGAILPTVHALWMAER